MTCLRISNDNRESSKILFSLFFVIFVFFVRHKIRSADYEHYIRNLKFLRLLDFLLACLYRKNENRKFFAHNTTPHCPQKGQWSFAYKKWLFYLKNPCCITAPCCSAKHLFYWTPLLLFLLVCEQVPNITVKQFANSFYSSPRHHLPTS